MLRTAKTPPELEAIFEKAEERLEQFFGHCRHDPTKGSLEISGERFVLVRGAALSVEFFDIVKRLFGFSKAEATTIASQILFDIAHALGKADATFFHKSMGLNDPVSKLSAGPILFAHAGWALVDISDESRPAPNEDYFLLYDHPNSFEADAWSKAGRRTDFPVCLMNAGYSSGWCEESFGLPLVATEVCCQAKGDEVCRFIMAPPSRMDEHVAHYWARRPGTADEKRQKKSWTSFKRDWTKEALLEKTLRDSVRSYLRLFEASPDGILVWDPRSKILAANRAAAPLFGFDKREDLIGKDWRDLIAPADRRSNIGEITDLMQKGGMSESEFRMRRINGSDIFVQFKVFAALDDAGNPAQTLAIARDISDRKAAEAALQSQALHDSLTGLANRAAFRDRLHDAFASGRRRGKPLAVLYFDLDHFKDVNDTLGHTVGDSLLQAVAARLKSSTRDSDVLARFGGDEFAVLLTELTDPADAGVLAAKLLKAIAVPYQINGNQLHVTVSIGISVLDSQIADPEAMLTRADLALYRAKEQGRDRYCFHSVELDQEVHDRVVLMNELRVALEAQELELYYQPQIELATGRIVALEALVRWNHPRRGLLMPQVFIPIAERTGTICALGHWVLDAAFHQIKAWRDQGVTAPLMAINVSAAELHSCTEFEQFFTKSLQQWSILPENVELEFTETLFVEAQQAHREAMSRFRELGTSIAIDDFGTGYSSLALLSSYPINRLKIAQQFILGIPESATDMAITRATIGLARELGIKVVAEGIQTKTQLDFLVSAGCVVGQGYYFSRPVKAAQAGELLRRGVIAPGAGVVESA